MSIVISGLLEIYFGIGIREHLSDSEFYLDVDLGKEEKVDIFTEVEGVGDVSA